MVFSANWSKKKSVVGRRMGFLLVFFPEEDHHQNPHCNSPSSVCHSKIENNTLLSFPSSPARASSPSIAHKSGSSRGLMCKAQSTLSICSLFVFTTFLLFTLSTFEPTTAIRHGSASTITTSNSRLPRRILLRSSADPVVSPRPTFPVRLTSRVSDYVFSRRNGAVGVQQLRDRDRTPPALQGIGKLYRRGTGAMSESDLLVADVDDEVNDTDFRAFLRILHNNGLLSRSDFVFLFSSPAVSSQFSRVIDEENDSLHRVISAARGSNRTILNLPPGLGRYFAKSSKGKEEVVKEPIWGKGGGTRRNNDNGTDADESTRPNYGSMVGFEASELDPENSLSGFLDRVPMGLRKWACYPMLLGRVRRKYKHVGLVDMKEVVILNDPFSRVKNRSPESVMMWTEHNQGKETASRVKNESDYQYSRRHNHRSSKGGHKKGMETDIPVSVSTGIVVGGTRGVRMLSDAVLTQIARAAMEHSSVSSKAGKGGRNTAVGVVTQSAIVNKLVHGGKLLLTKVDLVVNDDGPIPEASELATVSGEIVGQRRTRLAKHAVARWDRNRSENDNQRMVGFHEISKSVIVRGISCLSELQFVVYRDCLATSEIISGK